MWRLLKQPNCTRFVWRLAVLGDKLCRRSRITGDKSRNRDRVVKFAGEPACGG